MGLVIAPIGFKVWFAIGAFCAWTGVASAAAASATSKTAARPAIRAFSPHDCVGTRIVGPQTIALAILQTKSQPDCTRITEPRATSISKIHQKLVASRNYTRRF